MDRPIRPITRPRFLTALATAGLVAALLAPVPAIGAWLLVADPVVAAEVAAERSMRPLVVAIVEVLGRAIVAALACLQ
jgi:hypothetical protein